MDISNSILGTVSLMVLIALMALILVASLKKSHSATTQDKRIIRRLRIYKRKQL